ncbi:MAG: 2-isopropylmalate synthase [Acidobacteria bacterium]|nr:MAG: 2-isopropylmalate synthase [Acidobacteriota bacterium]PYY04874.1 MAG: 2-isopropylmalate synthase [Acidobacteriota bacterium]
MSKRERIQIFDTTLRDGEQAPGYSMNKDEKLRMARQLDQLGVDVIEAGFPIASEGDFLAVQAVAREIRRPTIAALARCCRQDIERAWQALQGAAHPRIHSFLATSDIHLHHKLRISRQQCLEQAGDAVQQAKSLCQDVEFSPEDATRSDADFLCQVLETVVEAGATTVNLPDTVGYTVPSEYAELIRTIRQRVRGIERVIISVHCHNDLGLAVANSLAAVAAGARQVECTINGIGERAGNASLEEVVMATRVRPDRYPYQTAIRSEQLFPSSQLLSEITGVAVQPNKAIIGRNAFAHEAGIHQDGMIKNPLTYEIMTPQSVGVPSARLVLGKHSGRHALGLRCEQLGFQFSLRELDEIYRDFIVLADTIKTVEDHHVLGLIRKRRKQSFYKSAAAAQSEGAPSASIVDGRVFDRAPVAQLANEMKNEQPRLFPAEQEQDDYLWGV